MTHSYSVIFLLIRSLRLPASTFPSTQQEIKVSEMRDGRSERYEVLNMNVNYGEVFQYLNLLAVSWDLAIEIWATLQSVLSSIVDL